MHCNDEEQEHSHNFFKTPTIEVFDAEFAKKVATNETEIINEDTGVI